MFNNSLNKAVAILIDADNYQGSYIEQALKLSDYYGQITFCKAYGDWTTSNLSSRKTELESADVELIQVNQVGKNATDNRLLVEVGELLGNRDFGIDTFIIISGDGDFASLCDFIEERGKTVFVMSNRNKTSGDLVASCDKHYYLEDLDKEFSKLEKYFPIEPNEARQFFKVLVNAYHKITKENVWVSYDQLGQKLHELIPNYKERFGQYHLSLWLRNFHEHFEKRKDMLRWVYPNSEVARLNLLVEAYRLTKQSREQVHLAQLGTTYHLLTAGYEHYFDDKKLSEWLRTYPETFTIHGDYVIAKQKAPISCRYRGF